MNLDRVQRMVCSWLQIMNAGVRSFQTELIKIILWFIFVNICSKIVAVM
jgi:hypothetical protein